jgi:hypothetical protein
MSASYSIRSRTKEGIIKLKKQQKYRIVSSPIVSPVVSKRLPSHDPWKRFKRSIVNTKSPSIQSKPPTQPPQPTQMVMVNCMYQTFIYGVMIYIAISILLFAMIYRKQYFTTQMPIDTTKANVDISDTHIVCMSNIYIITLSISIVWIVWLWINIEQQVLNTWLYISRFLIAATLITLLYTLYGIWNI